MNEFDVIEELMDTEPFIRNFPTFSHYKKEMRGVSDEISLEFYASHVLPEEAWGIITTYGLDWV